MAGATLSAGSPCAFMHSSISATASSSSVAETVADNRQQVTGKVVILNMRNKWLKTQLPNSEKRSPVRRLAARMVFRVQFLQTLAGDVSINLRGR